MLSILGIFAVTVVFLVSRTGGTVLGDTTTHPVDNELLPQMDGGDRIVQPVASSNDRLSAIQIRFGTYQGSADCTIRVSLHEDDDRPTEATGALVAQQDWDCSDLIDSSPMEVLTLPAEQDSAGQTYDVVVQRIDERATDGVVVWAGDLRRDDLPAAVNGRATELTADIRPLYDPEPRWWDHLDVIMSRMAAYGPSWGTAGAFGALLLIVAALLAALPMTTRSPRALIIVVAVLALARGLLWSAAVPAFGGMDEPAHFSNVQSMAQEHQLPGQLDNTGTYSEQIGVAHDRLNLLSAAPGDRPDYSAAAEDRTTDEIDAASPLGGGGGPASAYPPAYYAPAAALSNLGGDSFFGQLMAARLWSVLLGVAGAVLLALIGRTTFPRSPAAQVAFAAAGVLHPMASHQFAIVNNDAWVIVAGFASVLAALELTRRPHARGLALLAGVIIGCGLLGKPFGVAVAVPLAIGWLVGKVRGRVRSVRDLATEVFLVLVGFAATYGAWRVAAAAFGIASQKIPSLDHEPISLRAFLAASVRGARWIWGSQFWGNFGWVRIPFPEPIPTAIFASLMMVAAGVLVWLVMLIREGPIGRRSAASAASDTPAASDTSDTSDASSTADASRTGTEATAGAADARGVTSVPKEVPLDVRILVNVSFLVGTVVALYAAAWIYYESTGRNDLLQGRYALMALPAILALPGLLVERLSRGRLSALLVNAPLAAAMGVLTLLGLKRVLETFYG